MTFSGSKIIKGILLFFVFLLVVAVVFWGVQWFSDSVVNMLIHKNTPLPASLETGASSVSASIMQQPIEDQQFSPIETLPGGNVFVGAEAGMAVQAGDGQKVLFTKNEQEKLPIASLTKLMTALVVLERYDLSQKVTVDAGAMAQEGEQGDLKLGQVLSVKDLLYIALIESSNRAAYQLSEVTGPGIFISLMNAKALQMGLANTHFEDTTGLDAGSYSTAQDLATLAQYLFDNYPLFKEIIATQKYALYLPDGTFHHTLTNTNELLGQDNIIGGKTGFTYEAKGCVVAIQSNPQTPGYVIYVVLGSPDRFFDMKKIIDWVGFNYQ